MNAVGAGPPSRTTSRVGGLAIIAGASLVFGSLGVWVNYADMPSSMLLLLRTALGGALVALVTRAGALRLVRRPRLLLRVVALGLIDALGLLAFFISMRSMNVAVAMFLCYLAPVYVAVAAPRLLRQRTEPVVYLALTLAVAGIFIMLVPSFAGGEQNLTAVGIVFAVVAGLGLAAYFLLVKGLRDQISSTTVQVWDCVVVTLALLPLALAQTIGSGHRFTTHDVVAVLALGVLATALAGTLFLYGMRFVKVQHASIVGLLEPVSAPAYALIFLGQRPTPWTLAGGALILVAGLLVVLRGSAEVEPIT